MIYSIPEANYERLCKKLTRISNKCSKYNCEFHFEELGTEFVEQYEDGKLLGAEKHYKINVSGKAMINDWVFVATLQHMPKGNIVRVFDSQEVPSWAYTVEPKCDHCKTKHNRKDTYLIRNTKTGEFKQVGKSCLKDFTNGLSAEDVAQLESYMDSVQESCTSTGIGHKYYTDVNCYLMNVVETVKHFGYISKANAQMTGSATCYRAYAFMRQDRFVADEMEKTNYNADTQENQAVVVAALDWLNKQEDEFGYMHNLKLACSQMYCETRDLGIIASLIPTYNRAQEKELEKEKAQKASSNSKWVGEVGERITMTGNCKCVTSWENQFGVTYVYKFTTEEGNIFTWKTGKSLSEGALTLKGTIKAHNEFRGAKKTELTRCKVI